MKLAILSNGTYTLAEVENGREVNAPFRGEEELYAAGWKKACLSEKPSEQAEEIWTEHPTCIVQEWRTIIEETQ